MSKIKEDLKYPYPQIRVGKRVAGTRPVTRGNPTE